MSKRFTKDFLHNLCKKYNIYLLREYNEKELNYRTIIEFNCTICNLTTSKRFQYINLYDALCHNCSYLGKGDKARKSMKHKYGVENISQLDEIKNKKKETTKKLWSRTSITK
jgi:hypothetical protein